MSRSYKHTPRCGERKGTIKKRIANHVVRRKKLRTDFPQYAGYRKLYERWDICDYDEVGTSFGEYCFQMRRWASQPWAGPVPDPEELWWEYKKAFIRK